MDKKELIKFKKLTYLALSLSLTLTLTGKSSTTNAVNILSIKQIQTNTKIERDIIPEQIKNYITEISKQAKELLRETIYIGDSRTQGLLDSGAVNEEQTIYGIGYGYKWLIGEGTFKQTKTNAVNGALYELPNKMEENKLYNIVIWLGVNDYKYYNATKYFEEFVNLALNNPEQNIYIISVGPVDENPYCPRTNKGINEFNTELEELITNINIKNLKYINLNLTPEMIKKYDKAGIHYGIEDYITIQNIIETSIIETKKLTMTFK